MALGLMKLTRLLLVALALAGATAGAAPRATATDDDGRLELRFLGQQIIPTATQFQGTQFGGLSGSPTTGTATSSTRCPTIRRTFVSTRCESTSPPAFPQSRSSP